MCSPRLSEHFTLDLLSILLLLCSFVAFHAVNVSIFDIEYIHESVPRGGATGGLQLSLY